MADQLVRGVMPCAILLMKLLDKHLTASTLASMLATSLVMPDGLNHLK